MRRGIKKYGIFLVSIVLLANSSISYALNTEYTEEDSLQNTLNDESEHTNQDKKSNNVTLKVYTDEETIKYTQNKLNNLGYSCGEAGGELNESTINAIIDFQKDYNLTLTGTVNEEVLKKLESFEIGNESETDGKSDSILNDSDKIFQLQNYLNKMGYGCGLPDGIYGDKTEESLKQYMSDYNVEWNGEVTEVLLETLANESSYKSQSLGGMIPEYFIQRLLDDANKYGEEYTSSDVQKHDDYPYYEITNASNEVDCVILFDVNEENKINIVSCIPQVYSESYIDFLKCFVVAGDPNIDDYDAYGVVVSAYNNGSTGKNQIFYEFDVDEGLIFYSETSSSALGE